MALWKQVLWWITLCVAVGAGILTSIPPSEPSRFTLWLSSLATFLVFLALFVWLDRERRSALKHSSDLPPSNRHDESA
jgi:hypothetical protein